MKLLYVISSCFLGLFEKYTYTDNGQTHLDHILVVQTIDFITRHICNIFLYTSFYCSLVIYINKYDAPNDKVDFKLHFYDVLRTCVIEMLIVMKCNFGMKSFYPPEYCVENLNLTQ